MLRMFGVRHVRYWWYRRRLQQWVNLWAPCDHSAS